MVLLGDGKNASSRNVVDCADVEQKIFGVVAQSNEEAPSDDIQTTDDDDDGGVPILGHLGPITPIRKQTRTKEDLTSQQLGRQRAANREKVRQAARRGTVFGFRVFGAHGMDTSLRQSSEIDQLRKVEAVQGGRVVEASFAKGPWGVRWKDDQG